MEHVPVVDIARICETGQEATAEELAGVAEEISTALSQIGFVYLSNHGIDRKLTENAFKASKAFFELPQPVKDKSLISSDPECYHGYAKNGQILPDQNSTYLYRESFDILTGSNRVFPEDCPEFRPALTALENECKPLLKNLLRVLAIAMKLDSKEYFVERSKGLDNPEIGSFNTLRSIYYPAVPVGVLPGTKRCAEHTDIGMLTLLFQDDMGGLQVKSVNGQWIDANPIPDTVLLNTGDLLEFWSGGKYPATCHRVLIPEAETKKRASRQSIVFFFHPDEHVCISPLTGNSSEYQNITAKEHALKRLAVSYN